MNWNWWYCPERASYRSKPNRSNNPRSSSRRGASTPRWNRRSTRWKSTAWTCAQTMESAASSVMLRWRWSPEISAESARFCGSRSKSVRRERENILIATLPTSSQRKRRRARRTSVIPGIAAYARPEIENLTQRTANPVMPEIKSKKTAARVKIGPADFLKTGVLWQTLLNTADYVAVFFLNELEIHFLFRFNRGKKLLVANCETHGHAWPVE